MIVVLEYYLGLMKVSESETPSFGNFDTFEEVKGKQRLIITSESLAT